MSLRTAALILAYTIAVPVIIAVGFIGGLIAADLARGLQ